MLYAITEYFFLGPSSLGHPQAFLKWFSPCLSKPCDHRKPFLRVSKSSTGLANTGLLLNCNPQTTGLGAVKKQRATLEGP